MTSESREVLSALIDREPVDPDVLAMVLEDARARAMLVDFVRLRERVSNEGEDEAMGPGSYDTAGSRRPIAWWRAAAAALLLSAVAGGGYLLGHRLAEERPPSPARVLGFEPGVDWQAAR